MGQLYRITINESGDTGSEAEVLFKDNLRKLNGDGLINDFNVSPSEGNENAIYVEPNKDYRDEIEDVLPETCHKTGKSFSYEIEVMDSESIDFDLISDSEREHYQNRIEDLKDSHQTLVQQYEARIDELKEELEELESKNDSVIKDSRKKQERLDEKKEDLEHYRKKLEGLEAEYNRLQNNYDELETENERLENKLEEATLEQEEADTVEALLEGKADEFNHEDFEMNFNRAYEAAKYSEINYLDINSDVDRDSIEKILNDDFSIWSEEDNKELKEAKDIYEKIKETEFLESEDLGVENIERKLESLKDKKSESISQEVVSEVNWLRTEYSDLRREIGNTAETVEEFNVGVIDENRQYRVKIPDNEGMISKLVNKQIEDKINKEIEYDNSDSTRDILVTGDIDLKDLQRKVSSSITGGVLDSLNSSLTVKMSFNNTENTQINLRNDEESLMIQEFLRGIKKDEDMPDNVFRNISNIAANINYENPVKAVLNDWDEIYGRTEKLEFDDSEKVREMSVVEEARE